MKPVLQKPRPFRLKMAQPTESSEGEALIRWRDHVLYKYPALAVLYHIPNGGARSPQTGARLKREGVRAGMPDYCLPVPRGGDGALYLELKRRSGGQLSDAQHEMHTLLRVHGNRVEVAAGWEAARDILLDYLSQL